MIKIKLDGEPYVDGTFYRLPREDGGESIYAMEGWWYQAEGTDEDGNEYTVFWDILPEWDGDDAGYACDWDHPTAVVREDPWSDATALAVII